MKTLHYANGDRMPSIGLGTWKSKPNAVYNAVLEALRLGYRHIDCAPIYGNEAEVGRALATAFKEGVVRRDELWITSKLWNNAHGAEEVQPALEKTLADLQLEALDLYLIHWPVAIKPDVLFHRSGSDLISLAEAPIAQTWSAMESLVDSGLCRHIGVSNFSIAKLEALLATARRQPEMNQIELHPYLQQPEMLDFCQAHQVLLTAYAPLGSPDRPAALKMSDEPTLLDDAVIKNIAARHHATPAQILISWALTRHTAVIPKSVTPARIKQNLQAAQLALSSEDMREIASLDRRHRYVSGNFWVVEGGPYTMANLWDE